MVKNVVKHFILVTKHRWAVFKLCCRVGLPWRGFLHDLSKFSPTEFLESVKYYNGHKSPITICKKEKGYSEAWLHHKGRNKHHEEYWIDEALPRNKAIIMPYKYAAEMVCDKMAAGLTYQGKEWTKEYQLNYYMEERKHKMKNEHIDKFLIAIFTKVSEEGIDKALTKKNVREMYDKYCIRLED